MYGTFVNQRHQLKVPKVSTSADHLLSSEWQEYECGASSDDFFVAAVRKIQTAKFAGFPDDARLLLEPNPLRTELEIASVLFYPLL